MHIVEHNIFHRRFGNVVREAEIVSECSLIASTFRLLSLEIVDVDVGHFGDASP